MKHTPLMFSFLLSLLANLSLSSPFFSFLNCLGGRSQSMKLGWDAINGWCWTCSKCCSEMRSFVDSAGRRVTAHTSTFKPAQRKGDDINKCVHNVLVEAHIYTRMFPMMRLDSRLLDRRKWDLHMSRDDGPSLWTGLSPI